MASSILHPPAHLSPSIALQLSQQAPGILSQTPSSISQYTLASLFSKAESAELWTTYENLLLSCLRTGDEQSARLALQRLRDRFGGDNEKVKALHGLFQEATAEDDIALERVLSDYDNVLEADSSNVPIARRRIALLKSMGRIPEAITGLIRLVDSSPTDAEAWAELAHLYASQGLYQQAVFALEEVLLITPNAWNMHAKLGEVLYIAATTNAFGGSDAAIERDLSESLRRFCRSVELCNDYLRGYYGLKLTSSRLLALLPQAPRPSKSEEKLPTSDIQTVQLLNQISTAKLGEILRRSTARESGWQGYDAAELIAAQELLNRDSADITR